MFPKIIAIPSSCTACSITRSPTLYKRDKYHHCHFTCGETEVQRSEVTWSMSPSKAGNCIPGLSWVPVQSTTYEDKWEVPSIFPHHLLIILFCISELVTFRPELKTPLRSSILYIITARNGYLLALLWSWEFTLSNGNLSFPCKRFYILAHKIHSKNMIIGL